MIKIKDIKTKSYHSKNIKVLDKSVAWTERIKDPVVYLNDKVKDNTSQNENIYDYGNDKIKYHVNRTTDETVYMSKKIGEKGVNKIKKEYSKNKILNTGKVHSKKNIKISDNKIKNTNKKIKKIEKTTKDTVKLSKKMMEQGRKLAIDATKKTVRATKIMIRALVSFIKAIILAVKSLIGLIASLGSVAIIIIIVICLVALLVGSIFGIFFANEGESRTMTSVISEVNQEVFKKIENEQFLTKADDVMIDSSYSNWKEIIAVYSVKYSNNSNDNSIVMYLNDDNVSKLKNIFYDFNTIKTEVKREQVQEKYDDYLNGEQTRTIIKNILHIKIESKTLEEIEKKYSFTDKQKNQVNELLDKQYDDLWISLLYGSGTGEYVLWRQKGSPWSNIQIGTSGKSVGDIGCLATSIAMLIEKSNVFNPINPFNPGTFVEELNKNGGFDRDGNLQYSAINKVVPNFEYGGRIELKGKSKLEKLKKINEYQSKGYYLAVEVKGDTGQHWVAVLSVNGNNINMADPGSDGNIMWNTYNWNNTSQFVYFKVKG